MPEAKNSGQLWHLTACLGLAIWFLGCGGGTATSPTTAPVVSSASPPVAAVGAQVTLTGANFTASSNHVKLGLGYVHNLASPDSRTLVFVIPNSLSPCAPDVPVCTLLAVLLQPGDYPLSVINDRGTSNTMTFSVLAE